MMNLSAYDAIYPKVDKQKTWVDINRYQLLSREIKYRRYVTLCKRYNKEENDFEYFIVLLDDFPYDRDYTKVRLDDYGRIKVSLKSIWKETILNSFEHDCNITISHIEHTDDGDIYKLNL